MTKIPKKYWKKPPGEIRDLDSGEAAWIRGTDLILGRGGVAYLRKDGKTYFSRDQVQADKNPHVIPLYHVDPYNSDSDDGDFYVHLYEPERALAWHPNQALVDNVETFKVGGLATQSPEGEDDWYLSEMRRQLGF